MGLKCQYKTPRQFCLWAVVFRRPLSRSLLFLSMYLVFCFSWLGYLFTFFCDILWILFSVLKLTVYCLLFLPGMFIKDFILFFHTLLFSRDLFLLFWLGSHIQFFKTLFPGICSCFCAAGSSYCVHIHFL